MPLTSIQLFHGDHGMYFHITLIVLFFFKISYSLHISWYSDIFFSDERVAWRILHYQNYDTVQHKSLTRGSPEPVTLT